MNVVRIEMELRDMETTERYYLHKNITIDETIFLMDTLLFDHIEFSITRKIYDYINDNYTIVCYVEIECTKLSEHYIRTLKRNGFTLS